MIIKALKLRIVTADGEFGFYIEFSRHLTVIRGSNSSGKSTLVNSLLYGLGMEELIGGKGERVLPYALKDWFEYEGQRYSVIASEVLAEVENKDGKIITTRRAIVSQERSSKLIEIIHGAYLTQNALHAERTFTYLHDPGAAQVTEGFYNFLERFLHLNLPLVPAVSGKEVKLYLQTIFAALFIEQKRGWTDYIANIPYYGISNVKSKVVEYLLGLNVFESNATRNRLNNETTAIAIDWEVAFREMQSISNGASLSTNGVPPKVDALFDPDHVKIAKKVGNEFVPLPTYFSQQRAEYQRLEIEVDKYREGAPKEVIQELDNTLAEISRLTLVYEELKSKQQLDQISRNEYETLLLQAREDLTRNKIAEKLRTLGAQQTISLASDQCPTCHQIVGSSLLLADTSEPQMGLAENIKYLDSQIRMLERQIAGISEQIQNDGSLLGQLTQRIEQFQAQAANLRRDMSSGTSVSRASVRRQIEIEGEVGRVENAEQTVIRLVGEMKIIADRFRANQEERKRLPKDYYSNVDLKKINAFETFFRANAAAFDYESADISEIEINRETLTPFLAAIALREVYKADIRSDSSASDFVRLIEGVRNFV